MTKSNRKRAGLQKKVSSVFKGVPIPGSKRQDRSHRMPSPRRGATVPLPKPSDSETHQEPVVTRPGQPAEPANRTVPAHFTSSMASTSINRENSQSPEVEKVDRLKESVDKIALEYMAAATPPTSTDSEGPQVTDAGKADGPEEVAERTVPESMAAAEPPLFTDSEGPQVTDAGKADEPEEVAERIVPEFMAAAEPPLFTDSESPQDTDADEANESEDAAEKVVPKYIAAVELPLFTDSEDPQDTDADEADKPEEPAERTVPDSIAAAEPPLFADSGDSQDPDADKADEPDEPADNVVSQRVAASPEPGPAERQSSQSSLLRKIAECEEPSPEPAPVKPEEASHRPGPARTPESSRKPTPSEQPAKNALAESSGPSLGQQIRDKIATSKLGSGTAKDKAMVILVPLLAIVMIFMFRQVLRKSPGKAKGAAKDDTPAVVASDTGDGIEWELPEPIPASTMRDPARLPSQDDTQSPAPVAAQKPEQEGAANRTQTTAMPIRSLVYSEDMASVVIGNKLAHVGDKINGVTIARINKDSVEFEKDGKTWVQECAMRDRSHLPAGEAIPPLAL